MPKSRICSIDGCGKPSKTRGLCSMHYERLRKHGDTNKVHHFPPHQKCSVPECAARARTKGFCTKHHHRWSRYGDPNKQLRVTNGEALNFALKTAPAHVGEDCLIWPFAKGNKLGHGRVDIITDGKKVGHNASRVVCRVAHGEPPTPRHHAAHKCNVPSCVAPAHLYWATPSENERDKIANGTSNRGERCGSAKLTEKDVHHIRQTRRESGLQYKQIAERFDVTESAIRSICHRRTWAWLE